MAILTVDEITEKVAPIAKEYKIREVVLFGSYARGEADEASDVDLMVDLEESKVEGLMALAGLQRKLEETLGKSVDILDSYQVNRAKEEGTRFSKRYERDKKLIYT